MKFVAIVGTNSDRSTNRQLLHFMANHFAHQAEIEVVEIKGVPVFTQPEDKVAPESVQVISQKIAEADGVIISTPEYDHSITAALKALLEWISYTDQALMDKGVMIVGGSLGSLGTSRAQSHLRQILDSPELKARVMPGTEYYLSNSGQAFDKDGQLVYPEKVTQLENHFTEFTGFVEILTQLREQGQLTSRHDANFSWEIR
ncbi:NAD(P)H-dependent FMN reductase [Aerococcus sp. 150760007-1]|uniref:NAD(P)H-dependent oxidoreductase n=2 Tax=Aerococcus TaxID=1375 RepID=A0ABR5ZYT3_9LACT|nr:MULTISPECIES: NADPH-dependent FMN reductase [Lactobacillales]KAF3305747.1 NADPH-dependent FMN reductase [Carnobacterium sp. PL17GRE32]MBA5746907.1 NAD(P)H-dependent oxidoreductase [Aerococcus urinaeequi]MBA5829673.1 NAD(P)H-dependent oxidoreductase [Aerococcus urinaeequi]MBA5860690.1 NAD(P)H-dependent oxidoreductase [Aerococcus urinaeequi]